MDIPSKESPFPPASEVPLHKNAPLAPSQELAYRKKCMQLKRRLTEIETNNDCSRKRISLNKEHVQKLRLLRAILLNHLKTVMDTPAKKLTSEQLEKIGIMANGNGREVEMASRELAANTMPVRPENEGLLDDSSEDSDENEPEPQERPERRRRANNTSGFRESIMTTNTPGEASSGVYQQSGLSNTIPANSLSPRDAPILTSSFRVASSGPPASGVPSQSHFGVHQQQNPQSAYGGDAQYSQHSSPIPANRPGNIAYESPVASQPRAVNIAPGGAEPNGLRRSSIALPPVPVRPRPAFEQFTDHMRPQLEADHYPANQISERILTEWNNLSPENRNLWDIRYEEQMMDYAEDMDAWKKAQRLEGGASGNYAGPH